KGQAVVSVDGVELPLADYAALGGAASLDNDQEPYLRALALSPDGKTLAGAAGAAPAQGEGIALREAAPGQGGTAWEAGDVVHHQVAYSPPGLLVTCWDDVVLGDEAGREVDRIKPPGKVGAVRSPPDGKTPATLVVSDRDNSNLRLWDVATGETRATLRGLVGLKALKFSPDDGTLATGDEGGTVRLWDAHTGHLRLTLRGHRGEVDHLAFRPDGKALAAASASGPISLWVVRDR